MFHLLHSSRSWRALSLLIFGLLLSLPVRAGEGDDPLITNDYSEPSELVGVVEVNVLVGGEVVLDWSSPTLPVLESPTVLSMPQTPFGQAYFVGSDLSSSVYTLALPTGHAISLKWDPKLGRYSGWIGGYQVLVHYKPPTSWTYIPGLGMVAIVPVCLKGKWVGVTPTLIRPPGLSNDIDWIQFFTCTVTWEGTKADGTPTSGKASNTPVLTASNGGNPVSLNGSTVFVDSVNPGSPNYEDGGIGGDDGTTASITDAPHCGDPSGLAGALGIPPAGVTLTKIIFHVDFTTYLLVNDVVRWRFDWSFTEEYDMPHNGPVPTPREGQVGGPGAPVMPAFPNGLPTGGSANAMDADHQSALNNYNSGNFSGAPVQ